MIFQLVALLIAVVALATAAFSHQMSQWLMSGPDGTAALEPVRMRFPMMRLMGFVVAAVAVLMAFGSRAIVL